MRLPAVTAVTATVLALTFSQTPQVLAQDPDVGAASRPFPLDGGPSPGSDNQGQSLGRQSEGTERSGAVSSEKSETQVGETRETAPHGRKHFRSRHHVVVHRRGRRLFAFSHRRHHAVIHRHGHRIVALIGSISG
jgi:hypothetical protein